MAQTTAPATSIHVEEALESRMVVTFLMSGLESMVSREFKLLHHKSVLVFAEFHQYICFPLGSREGGLLHLYRIVYCPTSCNSLPVINCANSNLVSCCGVVVLKIILSNKWEIFVDCLGTAWLKGKSVFWSLSYVM